MGVIRIEAGLFETLASKVNCVLRIIKQGMVPFFLGHYSFVVAYVGLQNASLRSITVVDAEALDFIRCPRQFHLSVPGSILIFRFGFIFWFVFNSWCGLW